MFRKTNWLNIESMKEVYGIKVRVNGKWYDAGDSGAPLFFDTEAERDTKIQELEAGWTQKAFRHSSKPQ